MSYSRILAAIDLNHGEQERKVIEQAAAFLASPDSRLTLLHVVPAAPSEVAQFPEAGFESSMAERATEALTELGGDTGLSNDRAGVKVRFGDTYREILAEAKEASVDLIIIGSHKPGVADFLLGTNAARVVRHAPCSVHVVR